MLFQKYLSKKYNYIPQIDMRDCGVAALASVIQYHGSYYSLTKLRQLAKTNIEGTSALGIMKAAESLNFDTQAINADMSLFEMDNIPFPFIVHVNKKSRIPHYYVVHGIYKDKIIVGDPDPTVKITKLDKNMFSSEWSGIAIFIEPNKNYQIYREKQHSLIDFIPKLKNHSSIIKNIILYSLIITTISIIGSYYIQEILDLYIPQKNYSLLNIVTIGLVLSYILQQIISYLRSYLLEKLSLKLTSELFLGYLSHIFNLPINFFSTRRTGEIISRFTDATTIIDALASTLLSLFLDCTVILFIGIAMISQNKLLFLITTATIPIYGIIILFFVPFFEKINNEVMHENSRLNSLLVEDLNGIETIKSLASEDIRFKQLHEVFSTFIYKSLKLSKFEALQNSLKQTTQLLLNVIILWLGAQLVITQKLSIGQLITYNTLLSYFLTPLENIIGLQTKIQAAQVANNRLNEVYLVQSEHQHSLNRKYDNILSGDIELKNVSYQYDFDTPILTDINLSITSGEKICIVGASGSGKSSLAKLLVGFFAPTSGEIYIDGKNLNKINKKSLRRYINYLPQQPYIFSGSIMENLTLGDDNISEEIIINACKTTKILEDILNMPRQFQSEVVSGTTLSSGQKQRLALTRSLLVDSSIMILDESTSNLDITTEQQIINNLLTITNKTIIFIAHRLSIAKHADRIIVLEKGKIKEQGTHSELIKKDGIYRRLLKNNY